MLGAAELLSIAAGVTVPRPELGWAAARDAQGIVPADPARG